MNIAQENPDGFTVHTTGNFIDAGVSVSHTVLHKTSLAEKDWKEPSTLPKLKISYWEDGQMAVDST